MVHMCILLLVIYGEMYYGYAIVNKTIVTYIEI
jgi:hypothetical protein